VKDLDFEHSADTLPIPGKGISHAEYFKRKNIVLKHPAAFPMIVVIGRREQDIHLPAELVAGNELDERVKQQLPKIASFPPETRNAAIEKIQTYLTPGSSKGKALLPALGIILKDQRISAAARVLSVPRLIAAGLDIPQRSAEFWAPLLCQANFSIEPRKAVVMNVVLFHHTDLRSGTNEVYTRIRDFVNGFQTHYRLGEKPFATVPVGDNENHWGQVEQYFSAKAPNNVFVLDFAKPRAKLDPAYPVVKHSLTKSGYLSQFVNFKTYSHDRPMDIKKSNTILQGVARQILQKAGVRTKLNDAPTLMTCFLFSSYPFLCCSLLPRFNYGGSKSRVSFLYLPYLWVLMSSMPRLCMTRKLNNAAERLRSRQSSYK
jgi:hypothetical protein